MLRNSEEFYRNHFAELPGNVVINKMIVIPMAIKNCKIKIQDSIQNILTIEHDIQDISKRIENDSISDSTSKGKKNIEKQKKGKEFIPFQYYATTGEADDEPSQLESVSSSSTWDQKMEEVKYQ